MVRDFVRRVLKKQDTREPIEIVLWGKTDCSLCDRAKGILDRLSRDYPLQVTYRDITADPDAFERYRYRIPVVELPNGKRFEGKITEHWLRKELRET
ncbi:MAG TPA: glutaredoxin family protein [Chloroflexota bacterium]|nr:glutaredoxin family protein [Chloroflexota bacterium]